MKFYINALDRNTDHVLSVSFQTPKDDDTIRGLIGDMASDIEDDQGVTMDGEGGDGETGFDLADYEDQDDLPAFLRTLIQPFVDRVEPGATVVFEDHGRI